MTCNTEGTAVSEVATVVRNLDGIAMSGEMGNAGAMRKSRADSALLARAGETLSALNNIVNPTAPPSPSTSV
eukprot:scaffold3767_cov114-Isochrysis_galbana.AAC.6